MEKFLDNQAEPKHDDMKKRLKFHDEKITFYHQVCISKTCSKKTIQVNCFFHCYGNRQKTAHLVLTTSRRAGSCKENNIKGILYSLVAGTMLLLSPHSPSTANWQQVFIHHLFIKQQQAI